MRLFNGKEWVEVADDQVQDALSQGYRPEKGTKIPVLFDGMPYQLESKYARTYFADPDKYGISYHTEAQRQLDAANKKYDNPAGYAKAALAGLARIPTFGLSDQALVGSGVNPQTLKELELANPKSTIAGEIGGLAAGLFTGGTEEKAALEAGKTLAKSASKLGTVANVINKPIEAVSSIGKAAGGLAERAIQPFVVGGERTLAKELLAKALPSAVQAGTEGGFYGLGNAISEDALGDHHLAAESMLANMGQGALFGGLLGGAGSTLGVLGRRTGMAVNDASRAVMGDTLGGKLSSLTDFAKISRDRAIKALGPYKRHSDALLKRGEDFADQYADDIVKNKVFSGLTSHEDMLERVEATRDAAGKDIGDNIKKLSTMAEEAGEHFDGKRVADALRSQVDTEQLNSPLFKKEKQALEDMLTDLEAHGTSTLESANKLKSKLQERVNYDKKSLNYSFANDLDQTVAALVRQEIEQVASRAAATAAQQEVLQNLLNANRLYSTMSEAQKVLQNRVAAGATNRTISLTDYIGGGTGGIVGTMLGGVLGAPIGGALGAMANKAAREYGNQWLSLGFKALADWKAKTNNSMTRSVNGFFRTARDVTEKVPDTTRRVIQELHATEDQREPRKSQVDKDYAYYTKALDAAQDAGVLTANLNQHFGDIADNFPNVSASAQVKGSGLFNYLASKRPQDPGAGYAFNPKTRNWQPSFREKQKFIRIVEAATDPESVWKDFRQGKLTKEKADTLREVYPQLTQQLQAMVTEKFGQKKNLNRAQRLQLSVLMGQPYDARLANITRLQGTFAAQAAAQAQKPRANGASLTKTAMNDATQMTKLLMK